MLIEKKVPLRLFFNRSNMSCYVLIGETLFIINDKVAGKIQEKEQIEIVQVSDIKQMQEEVLKKPE